VNAVKRSKEKKNKNSKLIINNTSIIARAIMVQQPNITKHMIIKIIKIIISNMRLIKINGSGNNEYYMFMFLLEKKEYFKNLCY